MIGGQKFEDRNWASIIAWEKYRNKPDICKTLCPRNFSHMIRKDRILKIRSEVGHFQGQTDYQRPEVRRYKLKLAGIIGQEKICK